MTWNQVVHQWPSITVAIQPPGSAGAMRRLKLALGARPARSAEQYKTRLATLLQQSAAALDADAELYCSRESWPVTEAVFKMLVRHQSCCCNVFHDEC